ncbi:MAG: DUF2147 domain-containing protein [Spirochaetia bacterium]|nr:DUF2147 domain-containing protein [Spirochaetia bacterium]
MRNLAKILIYTILASEILFAGTAITPVGKWKTIDDKTHEISSIVELWIDNHGQLRGKVEKVITKPGEDPNPVCDKCTDENKNKPINGMEILWGFKQEKQNDPTKWVSGKILDPDEGEIYSCELTVLDGGKSLKVRGYIGIPLLGRSQTWLRTDQ